MYKNQNDDKKLRNHPIQKPKLSITKHAPKKTNKKTIIQPTVRHQQRRKPKYEAKQKSTQQNKKKE